MGKEDREMQLWAYIDGQCSDADSRRIALLISGNADWKEEYEQLLALHNTLTATEPEQPSLRFSRNVMEAINTAQPARAAKSYINPWVLRLIAGIFVSLLVAIFIYAMSLKDPGTSPAINTPLFRDMNKIDTGKWWMAIAGINIVLLVLFVDTLLRRRMGKKWQ